MTQHAIKRWNLQHNTSNTVRLSRGKYCAGWAGNSCRKIKCCKYNERKISAVQLRSASCWFCFELFLAALKASSAMTDLFFKNTFHHLSCDFLLPKINPHNEWPPSARWQADASLFAAGIRKQTHHCCDSSDWPCHLSATSSSCF